MFLVGFLSWWYGAGWRGRIVKLREQLASTLDYFSIDLLLRTLFSPFRQISAGQTNGPIGVKFRAFLDRLISRIIGSIVRSFMIIAGIVTILFHTVIGGVMLAVWAFIPLLPLALVGLGLIGWIPWR